MLRPLAYLPNLKSKLLLCCAMLMIVALLAITARAWLAPSAGLELKASSWTQPVPISPPPLQVERITITSTGFEPEEITRAAGQVMLAIDNRSGLEDVWLKLDREGGERLVDAHVEREKLDWRGRVTLTAGRYRLTEANHTDWVCLITVAE